MGGKTIAFTLFVLFYLQVPYFVTSKTLPDSRLLYPQSASQQNYESSKNDYNFQSQLLSDVKLNYPAEETMESVANPILTQFPNNPFFPPTGNSMIPFPPSGNSMIPFPPSGNSMIPFPPSGNSMIPFSPSGNSIPFPPYDYPYIPYPPTSGLVDFARKAAFVGLYLIRKVLRIPLFALRVLFLPATFAIKAVKFASSILLLPIKLLFWIIKLLICDNTSLQPYPPY